MYPSNRLTINTLPDDVLVEIFYFYANDWDIGPSRWHPLVHVCQRWRFVVFASARSLNLLLLYTGKRPMSEMLDVWPIFPVVICPMTYSSSICGNITAFLDSEHHHRIRAIVILDISPSNWERLATAMQKPFPELKSLDIWVEETPVTSLPDSFLGGSASLLRHLSLQNCSFPGMPKLLLSANHLYRLDLWNVPYSGYFSPQALVACLSVMSRLESLRVKFGSPQFSRHPPSLTRSVLPSLTKLVFVFKGAHQYLEDLLAQIEPPLLNKLDISMDVDFVVPQPQLLQLISHTESFKTYDRAFVCVPYYHDIQFGIFREANDSPEFSLKIKSRDLKRLFPLLARVCSSISLLSPLVRLDIRDPDPDSRSSMSATRWAEFFGRRFSALKDLRLAKHVAPHVCQALEAPARERVTRVLPALQNIFLSGLQPSEPVLN